MGFAPVISSPPARLGILVKCTLLCHARSREGHEKQEQIFFLHARSHNHIKTSIYGSVQSPKQKCGIQQPSAAFSCYRSSEFPTTYLSFFVLVFKEMKPAQARSRSRVAFAVGGTGAGAGAPLTSVGVTLISSRWIACIVGC